MAEKRTCPVCNEEFTPDRANQVYCKTSRPLCKEVARSRNSIVKRVRRDRLPLLDAQSEALVPKSAVVTTDSGTGAHPKRIRRSRAVPENVRRARELAKLLREIWGIPFQVRAGRPATY
jgi:hypothetical protein